MRPCPYPVQDLLLLTPPALLLDEVVEWDETGLLAALRITPASRFFQASRGVPVHVGIEYMAQGCGAFAGLSAREGKRPVQRGFLLGTRKFRSSIDWFPDGAHVEIVVHVELMEGEMAVFACTIKCDGNAVASARLTVYQPFDERLGTVDRQGSK